MGLETRDEWDAAGVYPMSQETRREDKTCPDGRKKKWKEEKLLLL
jgi:hypothetical protein